MPNQKEISPSVVGMNTDQHPSRIQPNEFTYMLNGNIEALDGSFGSVQNETSNYLELDLSMTTDCGDSVDYKVIGHVVDSSGDNIYLFLVDPLRKKSEIGVLKRVHITEEFLKDKVCGDCNTFLEIPDGLESSQQTPFGNYCTIINQDCLGFDINYPIKQNAVLKSESCGETLYWTDGGKNPPRYLNITNIDSYFYCPDENTGLCEDSDPCVDSTDCEDCDKCFDCDDLRIFNIYKKGCLKADQVPFGGNLKRGVYEFLVAYCDASGNELSNYFSPVPPVSVFDLSNITLNQTELADRTSLSIKLSVSDLDSSFSYYKVVVVQTADIDRATQYYIEGVHPIDDTEIVYSSEEGKQQTTLNDILAIRPAYLTSRVMSDSNGYLFQGGLTAQTEINLQPVANLMGAFLRWQTGAAKEDLYKDGAATSLYKQYARGEVVPFGISFCSDTGYETPIFNLPGRPAQGTELDDVDISDTNVISINECSDTCDSIRDKNFQYFNTASILGQCDNSSIPTTQVNKEVTKICIDVFNEDTDLQSIDGETIRLPYDQSIDSLSDYVNSNLDSLCTEAPASNLCTELSQAFSPQCQPTFDQNCGVITVKQDDQGNDLIVPRVELVIDESIVNVPNYEESLYADANLSFDCDVYDINNEDELAPFLYPGDSAPTRDTSTNTSCNNSDSVANSDFIISPIAYSLNHDGSATLSDLQQANINSEDTTFSDGQGGTITYTPTVAGDTTYIGFTDKLHTNAIWFDLSMDGQTTKLFQISAESGCTTTNDNLFTSPLVRVSVYESCPTSSTVLNPISVFLADLSTTANLFIDSIQENVYIAIDAPIIQRDLDPDTFIEDLAYTIAPPCGCFSVSKQDAIFEFTDISFSKAFYNVETTFVSTCVVDVPVLPDCGVIPYEYGKMSYWQSESEYSSNKELYDSSNLTINESDIPTEYLQEFQDYFSSGSTPEGQINLNENTDLRCKKIRHHKMPCKSLSPYIQSIDTLGTNLDFNESVIFPLGVSLDPDMISTFLNIAVNNNLISQDFRDSITSYRIYRGDRSTQKSIVGSGILVDMLYDSRNNRYFPNYPQNDLGGDDFHLQTSHPFNGESNNRYLFHSPETQFFRPNLSQEIKVEGYLKGKSRGKFAEVEGHPKFVVLGDTARILATTLAITEVLADFALRAAEGQAGTIKEQAAGLTTNIGSPIATALLAVAYATQAAVVNSVKAGRIRYEWLEIFRNNGELEQFAYLHSQEGFYNYFEPNSVDDSLYRGVCSAEYVKGGIPRIVSDSDTELNLIDREKGVYIKTSENINYPATVTGFDNSRYEDYNCSRGESGEYLSDVCVPLVTMYNYLPNQYSTLGSIKWLDTGFCGKLDGDKCDTIYGGDTFISRHTHVSKVPHFTVDAMEFADLTPFKYSFYSNLGESKYYLDYQTEDQSSVLGQFFPDLGTDYVLDCENENFYVKSPSKFYLYHYGIFNYVVESSINTNYRYEGLEPHQRFYGGSINNYIEWAQQDQFNIRRDNEFRYNLVYSKDQILSPKFILPNTYSKQEYDCRYDDQNGVIYSQQDNSESDLSDPWLVYKPLDITRLNTTYGDLVDVTGLESGLLLVRGTNNHRILNAIDPLRERLTPETQNLGSGGINLSRPIDNNISDSGYSGTQHSAIVSCQYGHFWADAKRGQVFQLIPNAKGFSEISSTNSFGQSTQMRNWFKNHLPFNITKNVTGLSDKELDNSYLGLGLSIGWDDRHRRVFFTKKDYKLKSGLLVEYRSNTYGGNTNYIAGFYDRVQNRRVYLTDDRYFEDCSWTIAYSPVYGRWISFYSFKPNYYISTYDHFKTGVNYSSDTSELGVWSHLQSNQSYQVFYGKKYPWELEIINSNRSKNKILGSVNYYLDTRLYGLNEYDFSQVRKVGFNKTFSYNHSETTPLQNIIFQNKKDPFSKFKVKKYDGQVQNIFAVESDKYWSFNDIYNHVKSECSNTPHILSDCNQIQKYPNSKALVLNSSYKDRLTGDWFLTRLIQDEFSQYKFIFKWATNSNYYY